MLRRLILFTLVFLLVSCTLAFASWKTVELIKAKTQPSAGNTAQAVTSSAGSRGSSQDSTMSAGSGSGSGSGQAPGSVSSLQGSAAGGEAGGEGMTESEIPAEVKAMVAGGIYGSQSMYNTSLTSLLMKNQNFFVALADGKIKELKVNATFFEPFGWPDVSVLFITVTDNKGNKSTGFMVLWCVGGQWRIAGVSQFPFWLGGGVQYQIPSVFEQDLVAEQDKLQQFLEKVAHGRLDYMMVDAVEKPSSKKTILKGRTVSVAGTVKNTKMTLEKSYGLWHITHIEEYTP
jgi:hypothetical protein